MRLLRRLRWLGNGKGAESDEADAEQAAPRTGEEAVSLLLRWDFNVPADVVDELLRETGASGIGAALYELSEQGGWERVFWDERFIKVGRAQIVRQRTGELTENGSFGTQEERQQIFDVGDEDDLLYLQDDVF